MNREELLRNVAPCGLVCYTCGGFEHGILKECAKNLINYLDGITDFLGKDTEAAKNIEAGYPMLEFFNGFSCPGCRDETITAKLKTVFIESVQKIKKSIFVLNAVIFHVISLN